MHLVGLYYRIFFLFAVRMNMFGSERLLVFNIIQDSTQPAKIQTTTKNMTQELLKDSTPYRTKNNLMHREHILSQPCVIQTTATVHHSDESKLLCKPIVLHSIYQHAHFYVAY